MKIDEIRRKNVEWVEMNRTETHLEVNNKLTIIVGGDVKADFKKLFAGPITTTTQPRNALYLHSYSQFDKLLSPSKLDLMLFLIEQQSGETPKSVSEIAKKMNRAQTAISRDLKYLKKMGLVTLKQFKQTVYAFSAYSGIAIRMGVSGSNC